MACRQVLAMRRGQPDDAAKRAALIGAQGPEAHNAAGQVLQAMGEFEAALAAYDRAAASPGPAQMRYARRSSNRRPSMQR
jgi:tetratricopeptide (TPR) repeat protein